MNLEHIAGAKPAGQHALSLLCLFASTLRFSGLLGGGRRQKMSKFPQPGTKGSMLPEFVDCGARPAPGLGPRCTCTRHLPGKDTERLQNRSQFYFIMQYSTRVHAHHTHRTHALRQWNMFTRRTDPLPNSSCSSRSLFMSYELHSL